MTTAGAGLVLGIRKIIAISGFTDLFKRFL